MTSFCDVNWRHDVILWRHTTSWHHIKWFGSESAYLIQHPPVTVIMLWHHNMMSHDVRWRHVMSHDVTWATWRHVMSHDVTWCHWLVMMPEKCRQNSILTSDLELWPMTLIIKLILDIDELDAHTMFRVGISNGSAVRAQTNWRTDRKTGPILLPRPLTYLDRWHGR